MTQTMPSWLIFAIFVTIGVTALLIGVLYRINLAADARERIGDDDKVPPKR